MRLTIDDLGAVYDECFDPIYRFLYYKVLDRTVAEDLTAEVFLALADAVAAEKEIDKPKAFVFGIARNIFTEFLKQKYRLHLLPLEIDVIGEMEAYVGEMEDVVTMEEKILPLLNKIPDKQQKVLKLRLIEKLSLGEIASHMDKNMNYVKTTQKRAIKSLRKLIALSQ